MVVHCLLKHRKCLLVTKINPAPKMTQNDSPMLECDNSAETVLRNIFFFKEVSNEHKELC